MIIERFSTVNNHSYGENDLLYGTVSNANMEGTIQ